MKASIERSATTSLTPIRIVVKYPSVNPSGQLQSIEILSPTKLRFTTTVPAAGTLALVLGSMEGVIVHPSQFNDPNLRNAPIGAGPYKIVSYTPGTQLKLTASESYWNAKNVKIKDVTVIHQEGVTAAGPTQGINRTTTGEFDYFNAFAADTASVLAATKGDIASIISPSDTQYTWFNICKNAVQEPGDRRRRHRGDGVRPRRCERAHGDEPDDRP